MKVLINKIKKRLFRNEKRLTFLLMLSILLINLLLAVPTYSDELFYFNAGRLVNDGMKLYSDFFFAHPPLQPLLLSAIFSIFGVSFFAAKLLPIVSSTLCLILVFLISGKRLKPVLLFALMPAFLAFSRIEQGMFLSAMFVLLSFFLLLRKKSLLGAVAFSLAFFTRYLSVLYLPYLLFIKRDKKFLTYSFLFILIGLFSLSLFYGSEFINDTILFHSETKFDSISFQGARDYLTMNLFLILPILLSGLIASILPLLIIDLIIFAFFKSPFYHYFIISIPFIVLILSKVKNNKLIALSIFLSIITAGNTILYYSTANSDIIDLKIFFSDKNASSSIFGNPIPVNYLSFVYGFNVSSNLYDSFFSRLDYYGWSNVIDGLEENPPHFIIDDGKYAKLDFGFYSFLKDNYSLAYSTSGEKFQVYELI